MDNSVRLIAEISVDGLSDARRNGKDARNCIQVECILSSHDDEVMLNVLGCQMTY